MDSNSLLHDFIDFFALLATVLTLIGLFIEPKDDVRRFRFFKFGLIGLILALSLYLGWEYWQEEQAKRTDERDVLDKEQSVMEQLCRQGEMNYEQLYNATSQGFSDTVLNNAIDDLAQHKHDLTTSWPSVPIPDLKTKGKNKALPVRLYEVDDQTCKKYGVDHSFAEHSDTSYH